MRTFLLRLICFICFMVLAYTCATVLWGLYAPNGYSRKNLFPKHARGYSYERLREVKKVKNVDLLILGSSHAFRGYDVRIFKKNHINSFVLGTSAQPPIVTELLLERYLNNLNPKLVILDIYPKLLASDGVESINDFIINDRIDLAMITKIYATKNISNINSLIFAYHKKIRGIGRTRVETNINNSDKYISGGYVQNFNKYKSNNQQSSIKLQLYPQQLKSLHRIIERLNAEKIKFVLIQSPISRSYYKAISNNEEIDDSLRKYGEYYNFNKILSIPNAYFMDDSHLNQYGVTIYNNVMIRLLKKEGIITQR